MTAAAVLAPLFTIEVNDPDEPGWESWHGFAGRRWHPGWPSFDSAVATARSVASHRRRWNVRVRNRDSDRVVHIAA